jgi:Amt family ammonium transporter
LCGLWGGIACGIFGAESLGGLGGVTLASQLAGSLMGAAFGLASGFIVYGALRSALGIRLTSDEERQGADMAIHSIGANPEEDVRAGRI